MSVTYRPDSCQDALIEGVRVDGADNHLPAIAKLLASAEELLDLVSSGPRDECGKGVDDDDSAIALASQMIGEPLENDGRLDRVRRYGHGIYP